jgi:hypothetical protein
MNEDVFHLGLKALIKNNQNKILMLKTEPKLLKTEKKESFWNFLGAESKKIPALKKH